MYTAAMKTEGRFATLLGADEGCREIFNRPLLGTDDWVVAPTLGSIVPNWLIAVPRHSALNCRQWYLERHIEPLAIVSEVAHYLSLSVNEVLWFEHGPANVGTPVGCGTDYAHLHLILRPSFSLSDLVKQAHAMSEVSWSQFRGNFSYGWITSEDSYVVMGQGTDAIITQDRVAHLGSQFMRRVIAALIGQPEEWNYKTHSHFGNILQTVETFEAQARAAVHAA